MLNPAAWNWGAKTGFFWAGVGGLCSIWAYFRVPEPKGRSYAEMDMLFEAGVSARKFKETDVASFATAGHGKGGIEEAEGRRGSEKASVTYEEAKYDKN